MLRNRSRAVTTKQALMADQTSSLSPTTHKPTSPISSFLNSPRLFNGFFTRTHFSETETSIINMSPTSILVNPFGYDNILSKPTNPTAKQDTKATGLALIDSIIDEKSDLDNNNELGKFSKPVNRTALFGSKLKVQIPVINPISPNESPKSPADFGIKTKNSQISSPCSSNNPVKDFTRQLSLKEMELSEDYTCVITHGPNPKTTHIYDDCIVERCLVDDDDDSKSCEYKKMEMYCDFENKVSTSPDFLNFCHTCKDILGQGKDIYIYRVKKPFAAMNAVAKRCILKG
ncbi:hypothetical protein CASFOL_008829 [Castilleja foliolosa]|uniref:FLZ-type domain-containing protein n=1 Tax=Castilleja foliolosa TaxID=1961234 RepID=A0ABD3E472_9LAMI